MRGVTPNNAAFSANYANSPGDYKPGFESVLSTTADTGPWPATMLLLGSDILGIATIQEKNFKS